MFKRLCGIILIMTFLAGMVPSFAAPLESELANLYNVVTKKYEQKKLIITILEGKELSTEIPGYLQESKNGAVLYVPASVIFRQLGATVTWNSKIRQLKVIYKSKTALFDVGKNFITVNNVKKAIKENTNIALMKYSGTERIMVPVSIISEQFGMEMKYLPETRTLYLNQPVQKILGMSWVSSQTYKEIRVKTSQEIKVTHYTIDGTDYGGKSRIIVEFQNSVLSPDVATMLNINESDIVKAELINPGKTPPRIRLEIETIKPMGYTTYFDKTTSEQVVQFVNIVKDIAFEKKGDAYAVVIKTGVSPEVTVKYLEGKVVLDLMHTKLTLASGVPVEKTIDTAGIKSIAYSQFDPSVEYAKGDLVTRVVLNYSDPTIASKAFVKKEADSLLVYISGDPDKGLRYDKVTMSTAQFEYVLQNNSAIEKELRTETNEIVYKIPKSTGTLESIYKAYNDNILQYVDVNTNVDPQNYHLTVKMEPGTTYYDHSDAKMISVAFVNEAIEASKNRKKRIVLDAGHGGSDPGAIGKFTGAKEKDLALKSTLALKTELEGLGYEVVLTRSGDYKVELYQRTDLANEVNADLFISIHYNAADSLSANGIEVLYYPEDTGKKYLLAKALYESLIRETGALGRGTVKRPLLVVPRETKMPSCLVEMGFLTHRDEEVRVQNNSYMNAQIKAIAKGIVEYFASQGL